VCTIYRGLDIRKDEKKKEEGKVNRKNKEKPKIKYT